MGIVSHLPQRAKLPRYLDALFDPESGIEHYWKSMAVGQKFESTRSSLDKTGLASILIPKVESLFAVQLYLLLFFSKFQSTFANAWALWTDEEDADVPASLVHHKSIVVKGPNGQEPQILRADSSFRVQLFTAALPPFIMCFTTSFHCQGNPWFDGVQLLSLNPNLHHEGEVKERQRPITTPNGTEIIYEPDYHRSFAKVW